MSAAVCAICLCMASSAYGYKVYNPCGLYCNDLTHDWEPSAGPGNGKIQHPELVLIFWQDTTNELWTYNTNSPTMGQYIGWAKTLANSQWSSGFSQYGGSNGQISRLRVSAYAPLFTGYPPNGTYHTTLTYEWADIKSIINYEIDQGVVPQPKANDDVLYAVLVPSNASPKDKNGPCYEVQGCNQPSLSNESVPYVGIYVNNIASTGGLGHEIAEGIVDDWEGVIVSNCHGAVSTQIGDVCECWVSSQNGFGMEAYWSQYDNACVIPESWGPLYVSSGQGTGWSEPNASIPMRQAAGGAAGVVATSVDDQVYFYSDANGWLGEWFYGHWWAEPLGPRAAEIAAGGGVIARLPTDTWAGQIQTYAVSQGWSRNSYNEWTTLPLIPSDLPVTSMTVTDQSIVAVTDSAGQPWAYPPGGPWASVRGPVDQLVASESNLLLLENEGPGATIGICEWSYSQWSCGGLTYLQNATVTSIVASTDAPYYGFVKSGPSGGMDAAWWSQGYITQSIDFAVSNGYEANYLLIHGNMFSDRLEAYACYSYPNDCAGNAWENTNGYFGRLISGTEMYGTGCVSGIGEWCANY